MKPIINVREKEKTMKNARTALALTGRLDTGAAILAAAEVVDVTLVKARLDAFANAHCTYTAAQRAVETAEAQLRAAQGKATQRDAEQDEAVEELARALVADGQPRKNPFAAFGVAAPSTVKQLTFAEEAKAIHKLAAAVQADPAVSKATRRVAQAAEETARTMETELVPMDKLQASLRTAREVREATGKTWDTALAALKRGARAAADDGAPGLYRALFGRPSRSKNKTAGPAPTPAPTPPAVNAA
jgi:hypothetical protein